MEQGLLQIIDANLNRTREGLRVCEDIARFAVTDRSIAKSLKSIRHGVTRAALDSKKTHLKRLVLARNVEKDVLRHVDFKTQKKRIIPDMFMSNIERVKESLRVLEECSRILDENVSRKYRRLRFNAYNIEKKFLNILGT